MFSYWMFFAVESLIISFFNPTGGENYALSESTYWILIIINSIVLLVIVSQKLASNQKVMGYVVMGFFFRLLFMVWNQYFSEIFLLPNAGYDEYRFYYQGMSYIVKGTINSSFSLLYGFFSKCTGLSLLYGRFTNIAISVTAIVALFDALSIIDVDDDTMSNSMAMACFLPNFAMISGMLLRESLIILCVAYAVKFITKWWVYDDIGEVIKALVCVLIATCFHSGMIAYFFGILCIVIMTKRSSYGKILRPFSVVNIVGAIIVVVGSYMIITRVFGGFLSYLDGVDSIDDVVKMSSNYVAGGSAYSADIVPNTGLAGFIINTPVRMLYLALSPLPWNWRGLSDIIAFLFSSVPYFLMSKRIIRAERSTESTMLLSGMILITLMFYAIFGWGVSNSGTALRHRDKLVIHFIFMCALISKNRWEEDY